MLKRCCKDAARMLARCNDAGTMLGRCWDDWSDAGTMLMLERCWNDAAPAT